MSPVVGNCHRVNGREPARSGEMTCPLEGTERGTWSHLLARTYINNFFTSSNVSCER